MTKKAGCTSRPSTTSRPPLTPTTKPLKRPPRERDAAADTANDVIHWVHKLSGVIITTAADDEDETDETPPETGTGHRRHCREQGEPQ